MKRIRSPRLLLHSFLLVSVLALSVNAPVPIAKGAAIQSNNAASCPRDGTYHTNFQGLGTDPSNNQTPFSRPVIFVHGWTGGPMTSTAKAIIQQFPNQQINPFTFDYSKWASYWALNPNIAPCLADYVNAVSDEYQKQGGDGKVILVAHSMGGLAIRYAMNSSYVQNPIQAWKVPYIITLDTPYLGSPWGNYFKAPTLMELKNFLFSIGRDKFPSPWGQDGGKCLAPHQYTAPLPQGCGDLPPLLPKGVQLTQIAGDVNVDRTLFGHVLYTIPLNSDGIVTVPSQHGYLNSGPGVQAPYGDVIVHSTTDSCRIDAGAITNMASIAFPEIPTFEIALLDDYLTLQDLQNNLFRPVVQAYYLAATISAACSHIGIYTDQSAINQMTEVIKSALAQLTPPLKALNHYLVPDPPFGQGFTTSGNYVQVSGMNGLEAVNSVLKNLIVQDQQNDQTTNPDYINQCRIAQGCWYDSGSAEGQLFVSASSSVVSVLIPTNVNYGGVSNESWVSATLLTQTARPITFANLFSDTSQALVAISEAARAELLATNNCVTGDLNALDQGLDPTNPDNFKHYAISPSGLSIGFDRYQLGIGACGGPSVTIPWSQLQSNLSNDGRQIVSNLR